MAKKRIFAGRVGPEKYFFDENGNVVDKNGAAAARGIAAAILAGIESIPEVKVEDKPPATPKAPKKIKQAKSKEESEEESSLSRVTQKVSSGRGSTRGTMGNIADVIGRGTIAASIGSVPSLRGVAAATLDAAGVGAFSTLGGGGGGGGRRPAAATSGDGKDSETESVGILEGILNVLKDNNELLQDLIFSLTAAARGRIEDERELEKEKKTKIITFGEQGSTPAFSGKGIGEVLGGFFKGGLAKILGPIEMMLSGLIGPLMNLAKFALRINPITAIFGAAVFSLNKTDWQEIFGALSTIFDDLTKGNWISALSTAIALIPDILIKGIGRLIANVLEWLGFEKESEELNSFITNLDIITPVKDFLIGLFDTIVAAVKGIMRSYVGNFLKLFDDINKLVDQIFSGDILGALDTAMQVVVRYFTMIPDMVIQGVGNLIAGIMDGIGLKEAAADVKEFLATFNLGDFVIEAIHLVIADIKFAFNWLKEKASNILTAITTWWNSWTISDVIITAFNDFKTKVGGLLAPVIEWWNSWTLVDVITTAFNNFKTNVSNILAPVIEWWNSWTISDAITTAFENFKTNVGNILAPVIEWWNSWTLVDIISTAFENFKTNVGNLLAPVIEWWNSWSITGAITTAFEDFKQKILAYFGPEFVEKIGEIANFDLAGYISKKIGEVFKTITDFFASIPGMISTFVTDQIKKLPFGLGEELLNALKPATTNFATGASGSFGGPAAQRNLEERTASVVPDTQKIEPRPAGTFVGERYKKEWDEKYKGKYDPITGEKLVQVTSAGSASANFGNTMAETSTVSATDLVPTENMTAPAFLKRANDLAISASVPAAPIIIDNSTKNNVTNSRPSSISPRVSSGAPSTAPVMSHIDRLLYPFIGAYP